MNDTGERLVALFNYQSEFGVLILELIDAHIHSLFLPGEVPRITKRRDDAALSVRELSVSREAATQLNEYFLGERRVFHLPLDIQGSSFQKAVWEELLNIPYGQTRSYGQLAAAIGKPKAARAVGQACNRNPLPLLIPCHRAVGGGGGLTGYRGGLDMKRRLLALEEKNGRGHMLS